MISEAERITKVALIQSIIICIAIETITILLLYNITENVIGAIAATILLIGPLSLFIFPVLYKFLKRTNLE